MSDLDHQLGDYMDLLVEGTAAVRAEDIIARPDARRRRPRRSGRLAAIVAVTAVVCLVGAVIAVLANRSTSPTVATGPHARTVSYHDQANGISLELPSGWRARRPNATRTGPQNLVEIRSPGRPPSSFVTRCVPVSAHGVTGARVWIELSEVRYPAGPLPARPASFAPQPGHFDPALAEVGHITTPPGCPPQPNLILFNFTDHQRKFQFAMVAGPAAPSPSITQAYGILDSLRVASARHLHRSPSPTVTTPTVLVPFVPAPPPSGVRVYVLNASNQPGADASVAARLATLGYAIAGTHTGTAPDPGFTNRSGQTVSLTSCRAGFSELGAATLARAAIGTATVSESAALETYIQTHNSDCLVVIGPAP